MADDHYSRPTRPSAPFARPQTGPRPPQSGDDPLAELARLIGKSDPYAGYGQTPSRPATEAHAHQHRYARHEEAGWQDADQVPHDPYAQDSNYQDSNYQAPNYPEPQYEDSPYQDSHYQDPRHQAGHGESASYGASYQDPRYTPQGYADASHPQGYDEPYNGESYSEPYYGGPNGDARSAVTQDQRHAPFAPPPYAEPQYSERGYDPRYGDQQGAPQFASPQYDDKPYPPYDNQLYAQQAAAFPPAAPHDDPYAAHPHSAALNGQGDAGGYYGDPNAPAYGAPYYHPGAAPEAETMPARKRGGMVTVFAVLALAVLGTAGAFGYRAVFGTDGTRVAPPVIKADTTPSKIVPASNDAKPIQDRVGDRAQIERIINREEQPVDVNAARAGAPRVVFPGANPIAPLPNSPIPPAPNAAQPSAPTASATTAASTEPKKIRTVTIRPDQPDLASAAQSTASTRASNPAGVPDDTAAHSQASAATSGPLSLAPAAPAPQQRTAPARTASAPATPAVGSGYSVQVTSQRSEADAQAAYAQLQAKFPSVLGNRQAVIRRADLGDKGTYYRAQIPFGSQGEAADFCTSLRNAGGQCVVQRN